jgi:hypothetical protein
MWWPGRAVVLDGADKPEEIGEQAQPEAVPLAAGR